MFPICIPLHALFHSHSPCSRSAPPSTPLQPLPSCSLYCPVLTLVCFLPPPSWPTVALSPHIASLPSSLQVGDVHALVEQLTGDNARLHRELAEHNKVGGFT